MGGACTIRVVDVDRLLGGVVISFDDGTTALFRSETLYSLLAHAVVLEDEVEATESTHDTSSLDLSEADAPAPSTVEFLRSMKESSPEN